MREVLLPHLLRADAIMFDTQQTGHARWIAGHILAAELEQIGIRDVVRAYRPLRPPERRREREDVMASLEAVSWLRAPTGEANPTRWLVNPRVHQLFASRAKAEQKARAEAKQRIAEAVARFRAKPQ
jgi:hypothetical protein